MRYLTWLLEQIKGKRSADLLPRARRSRRDSTIPRLESLEKRLLLTGNVALNEFSGIATSLDTELTALQNEVISILNTGRSLPFVGNQLGDASTFISRFQPDLQTALQHLDNFSSDQEIRDTLFGALGNNGGLNLIGDLNGDGAVLATDISVTHPASLGTGGVAIEMHLHSDPVKVSLPLTFSTGLPSLPVSVKSDGNVNLSVGFDYELAFQYNANTQLTSFDTTALLNRFHGSNPAHELAVTFTATVPGLNATADIGFMQGKLVPTTGKDPSAFTGTFVLDGLDETPSTGLTAKLNGQADVYLTLKGGFGGANDEFPTVGTDFELHWKFDSNNPDAEGPQVSFHHVTLDLGQFVDGVIEPILKSVQEATAPFKPVLDVLNTPIPGISDISSFLGEGDISLLTLATVVADKSGYSELANIANNVLKLIQTIQGLNLNSGIGIDLGGFDLNGYDLTDLNANPAAKDIDDLTQPNLTNLEALDASQFNMSEIDGNGAVPQGAKDFLHNLIDPAAQFDFHLPILESPAQGVFALLLGHDTPLVTLDASMHVQADSSKANGLSFAGVGLRFLGNVQADARLTLGYDTRGLREFVSDLAGNDEEKKSAANLSSDISDGFYVDTQKTMLSVHGRIYAEAGGSYGIVNVGIQGGINTGNLGNDAVTFQIDDSNNDGKLRFEEIPANPLDAFKLSGELDATLVLHVAIGVDTPIGFIGVEHDFGLAKAVLVDFNNPLPVPHTNQLASEAQDGNVTLYAGAAATNRKIYDVTGQTEQKSLEQDGVGENYSIEHVGDDDKGETIKVSAYGVTQIIHGVHSISATGDLGDLTINAQPGVHANVTFAGSPNHAGFFTYLGDGNANLSAGGVKSTLIGGYGINTLTGGAGDDEIVGGHGSNLIYSSLILGGQGNKSITVPTPNAGTFIAGGNAKSNSIEVLGLPSAKEISLMPSQFAGAFNLTVTDYRDVSNNVFGYSGGTIKTLVIGGAGARNIDIGDLSQTGIEDLTVSASPLLPSIYAPTDGDLEAISYLRGNNVTVQGSTGQDSFVVRTTDDPNTGIPVTDVSNRGRGLHVEGMSSDDTLTLDGRGGGDDFYVDMNQEVNFAVMTKNGGDNASGSLFVSGLDLSAGTCAITDGNVNFKWVSDVIDNAVYLYTDANVIFDDSIGHVTVKGPNDPETFTTSRSVGLTTIDGGAGNDIFSASGLGTTILDGGDGSDSYVVHWTDFNRISIQDKGTFGSDSLEVDDSDNVSNISATYQVESDQVVRQDHFTVHDGSGHTFDFISTNTIAFTTMSMLTLDSGLGTQGPNYIDVESTAANTATTINTAAGVNYVEFAPSAKLLDQIAGTVHVNGGSGYTGLYLYDQQNVHLSTLITTLTAAPGELNRFSLVNKLVVVNGVPSIIQQPFQESISYQNVSSVALFVPGTQLILDDNSSATTGAFQPAPFTDVSQASNGGHFGFEATIPLMPNLFFDDSLADLTINLTGIIDGFDVFDTPTFCATNVYMNYGDSVTVHGTTGTLFVDTFPYQSQTSVTLGAPLPRGGSLANIDGPVNIGTRSGRMALVVDAAADTGLHHGQLASSKSTGISTLTGVAPATISFGADLQSLSIHTDAGQGSDFTVLDTPANFKTILSGGSSTNAVYINAITGDLEVDGGTGNESVFVGDGTQSLNNGDLKNVIDLNSIAGTLTVKGSLGPLSLTLDDSANMNGYIGTDIYTSNPAYVVTDQVVSRTNTGTRHPINTRIFTPYILSETINYSGLTSLTIDGGQSGNAYQVQGTSATTSTTINAGLGANSVNVGDSGNRLVGIQGALTVNGQSSTSTSLSVFDQGTTTDEVYDVYATKFDRTRLPDSQGAYLPDMAPINYFNINSVGIHAGTGHNFLFVESTSANTTADIYSGNGVSAFDEFSAFLYSLQGPVNLHGPSTGIAIASLFDTANSSSQIYTLTDGALNRTGMVQVTYDHLAYDALYTSQMADAVVNVQSNGNLATYVVPGRSSDVVNAGSLAPALGGTLANIHGQLFVRGSILGNVVIDDSGDSSPHPAVTLKPSDAPDTNFQISGLTSAPIVLGVDPATPVTIRSGSGDDTFAIAGSLSAARIKIDGGGGNNTLAAPGTANVWHVTGAGLGMLNSNLTYSSFQNLVGGTGTDAFNLDNVDDVPQTLSVNGGGGVNSLIVNDQSSAKNRSYNLTASVLARTNVPLNANYSNVQNVAIHAGVGTNSYTGTFFGNANTAVTLSGFSVATQLTPTNLQSTINASTPGAPIVLGVDNGVVAAAISAVNGLPTQSTPTTIVLNLKDGTYPDLIASPPRGVTLIINGGGSSTTVVGHSPALTVTQGTVIVTGMTLTTATNSATILVKGGSLKLRDDVVQETSGGNQAAVQIAGGFVDLGATSGSGGDPGLNVFNINGTGELIHNTGANPIMALGNTFELNGVALTSPYVIEDRIFHALDSGGGGLVSYVANNVYVTQQSGSIQRAVSSVPAGFVINVQAGTCLNDYAVGARLLVVAFQNGPTFALTADSAFHPNSTTLRVTGGPQKNTQIEFERGPGTGVINVDVEGYLKGSFSPTGGIVAHGGGGAKAHIEVDRQIALPSMLFADGSDAHLEAGGGPTVEVGGGGRDTHLEGGPGRDMLIAGHGRAHLEGHGGDDILIGGYTDYDQNESALAAIMAEWTHTYSSNPLTDSLTRRDHLLNGGGLNGANQLIPAGNTKLATVHSAGVANQIEGGTGIDLFFTTLRDTRYCDDLEGADRNDFVVGI